MRGLGEKQRLDSYMTSSKIVFYLAKQPFTYYQLRRITKIHGDVLRRRLNDLDSKGIIIKFKYTLGPMNRNTNPNVYRYDYYLLNWSNMKSKDYFDYYSSYSLECIKTKQEEEEEERKFKELEQMKNKPLEKMENETENEYKERKLEIEQLRNKYDILIKEKVGDIVNRENAEIEKLIEDAVEIGSDCAKVGHSPLNFFIGLKVNGIFDRRENYYKMIWEAMKKAGLLDQYAQTTTT
jgi:chromosome segregation and condensation protein ScpB